MTYSVIIIYLRFYNKHRRCYKVFMNCEGFIEPYTIASEEYKSANFSIANIEVHVQNRYFKL